MTKLDENRKQVSDQIKKFEKTAQEIHKLADKMHKKMMQKLHREAAATREHARAVRKRAEPSPETRRTLLVDTSKKPSPKP